LFPDENGRFKKSLKEMSGEALIIPQYTLYGDLKSKNSPSFTYAMSPDKAYVLFQKFCIKMKEKGIAVKEGKFREFMKVNLVNEGPVTFILDSDHAKT